MANLQVKEINTVLYDSLKKRAREDNRSVSQEVVAVLQDFLAQKQEPYKLNGARVLLQLAGSWEDERTPEEIIKTLRASRRNSKGADFH